jgi:hypothetical protein
MRLKPFEAISWGAIVSSGYLKLTRINYNSSVRLSPSMFGNVQFLQKLNVWLKSTYAW